MQGFTKGVPIDTDSTLANNSDQIVASQKAVKTLVGTKQDTLISGTNIKTVGGTSLLGSGDISVSSGAVTLISTTTAANSTSVDIQLTGSYSIYKLIVYDYVAQTNNTESWLRIGTGAGPSWASGASDYTYYYQGSWGAYVLGDTKIMLTRNASSSFGQRFEITICNPSGSTYKKKIMWDTSCQDSSTTTYNYKFYGDGMYNAATSAITWLRILQSSNNISSGTFNLYGIS